MQKVSLTLEQHTGCIKTYVMQFAESQNHQHVHFHIVPRMENQSPDDIANKVLRHLGVSPNQRVSESDMNNIALKIRQSLHALRQ